MDTIIYFTIKDIAEACGVSGSAVRKWIYRGKIADVKRRNKLGHRLFTSEDLDRFVEYAESRPKDKKK